MFRSTALTDSALVHSLRDPVVRDNQGTMPLLLLEAFFRDPGLQILRSIEIRRFSSTSFLRVILNHSQFRLDSIAVLAYRRENKDSRLRCSPSDWT